MLEKHPVIANTGKIIDLKQNFVGHKEVLKKNSVKANEKAREIQSVELIRIKKSTFRPLYFLSNRHLQTILANVVHPSFPSVTKQRLELDDGDFIDLLWSESRAPQTLLILHGLEGSIHSAYAKRILNYCNHAKIAAVFMHFRGCGGEQNRQLRGYHSGETGDLRRVIEHLKSNGVRDIALLGYSLGGNATLKYMGEAETDAAVRCATAISVPLRLDICADTMDRGFARVYQRTLLGRLIKKMHLKRHLMDDLDQKYPDPSNMINFRHFDDSFTAPIHGFDSAQDYYQKCSAKQFLCDIDKPTLIIQSRDDPFMNAEVLPEEHELSDSVTLELSAHGGHVGFIGGRLWPQPWLEKRIHRFLIEQHFI
jgi:predicted alpha/beta-fold hydrolase